MYSTTPAVITGLAVGIVLVLVFALMTSESHSFTPEFYPAVSPDLPRVPLDDVDSGNEDIPSLNFGYEVKLGSIEHTDEDLP